MNTRYFINIGEGEREDTYVIYNKETFALYELPKEEVKEICEDDYQRVVKVIREGTPGEWCSTIEEIIGR